MNHTCKKTAYPHTCVRRFGPERRKDDVVQRKKDEFQLKGPSKKNAHVTVVAPKKSIKFVVCVRVGLKIFCRYDIYNVTMNCT